MMKTNALPWYVCSACLPMSGVFKKIKGRALRWKREEKEVRKEKKIRG